MSNNQRTSFVFFSEWADCLETLPPLSRLAVYEAIVKYAIDGIIPPLNGMAAMAFKLIRGSIDRNLKKYDDMCRKRREAINARWKKTTENEKYKIQMYTNEYKTIQHDHEHEHESEHENDSDKEKKKVDEKESAAVAATTNQRRSAFFESIRPHVTDENRDSLRAFADYWSEPTPDGQRMRFELERTWSLPHRLRAWLRREPAKQRADRLTAREQRDAEREAAYQRALDAEQQRLEASMAEQKGKAITYEEYLRQKGQ